MGHSLSHPRIASRSCSPSPSLPASHPHPPAGPSRVPSLSRISCRCNHPAAHIALSRSARELTLGEEGVE